jgi:cobalamin biosynthesis protein CobT
MKTKSKTELLKFWNGYFKKLSTIDSMIVGKKIEVRKCDDDLAYTRIKNNRRIISINPFDEEVPTELIRAKRFVNGLNAHEVGHQRFTDFDAHNNFIKILETASNYNFIQWMKNYEYPTTELTRAYTKKEVSLFHHIWNIVEDTSIEYWTYETTGGDFPNDLRFTVTTTYGSSPNLEEIDDPFKQICTAMIQYGDIGLLKGKFTFPEAREAFLSIQPIYDEAVEEEDAKKRILISYFIFEKLKPFWEPVLKQQETIEQMLKNLAKELSKSGKGSNSASASSASTGEKDEDEIKKKEKKEARKRKTIEMTRKEFEELLEKSHKSGNVPEGEKVDVKIIDDNTEDDTSSSQNSSGSTDKSDPKSTGDDTGKADGSKNNEDSDITSNDTSNKPKDNGSEPGTENTNDNSSKKDSEKDNNNYNASCSSDFEMRELDIESINNDFEDDDIWEDVEICSEDIDRINKEIDEVINNEIIFEKKNVNDSELIDFPDIQGRCFKKASCKNVVVSGSSSLAYAYENEVSYIAEDINKLAEKLKRASAKPNTMKTRRSSGRLSVDRYSRFNAHPTTKLFDKRRTAGDNDLAVYISVDESGSMSFGNRSISARRAAIGIAEACAKAKIPLYIMGFSADEDGFQAYHLHYVRWINSINERYSLMNISPRFNNFDGYSIRYASRLLQKRTERNKLLIVISDGQPAAHAYKDYSNIGVADTKDAVRQATADGLVVHGIAIGGTDDKVLKEIYGVNFTENANLSDLLNDFGSAILKQLTKER